MNVFVSNKGALPDSALIIDGGSGPYYDKYELMITDQAQTGRPTLRGIEFVEVLSGVDGAVLSLANADKALIGITVRGDDPLRSNYPHITLTDIQKVVNLSALGTASMTAVYADAAHHTGVQSLHLHAATLDTLEVKELDAEGAAKVGAIHTLNIQAADKSNSVIQHFGKELSAGLKTINITLDGQLELKSVSAGVTMIDASKATGAMTLNLGAASATVKLGAANSIVTLGSGASTVISGTGNDKIVGGAGNDIIDMTPANSGSDTFHYAVGKGGDDVILGFRAKNAQGDGGSDPQADVLSFSGVADAKALQDAVKEIVFTGKSLDVGRADVKMVFDDSVGGGSLSFTNFLALGTNLSEIFKQGKFSGKDGEVIILSAEDAITLTGVNGAELTAAFGAGGLLLDAVV